MPNLDKSGPRGEGPATGKRKGTCIDEKTCVYGDRKKCCLGLNKEFYERRRKRREN